MNYRDIKNKNCWEQLREAQLAISDLLESNNWKKYEKRVYSGDNNAEKMFIMQIKTFASNRTGYDLSYKLAEDANTLRKNIRKNDFKISGDDSLKREIYRALSKYVGIIMLIEAEN
ncbi:MAG: hypothetical protein ACPLXC_03155 [Candidatus Pacearchaeota archaeon]